MTIARIAWLVWWFACFAGCTANLVFGAPSGLPFSETAFLALNAAGTVLATLGALNETYGMARGY